MTKSVLNKLYIGFTLIFFMFVAMGGLTVFNLNKVNKEFSSISKESIPFVIEISNIKEKMLQYNNLTNALINIKDIEKLNIEKENLLEAKMEFVNSLKKIESFEHNPELKSIILKIKDDSIKYIDISDSLISQHEYLITEDIIVSNMISEFSRFQTELNSSIRLLVKMSDNISIKFLGKGFTQKLQQVEISTNEAIKNKDPIFISKILDSNLKNSKSLSSDFKRLSLKIPEIGAEYKTQMSDYIFNISSKKERNNKGNIEYGALLKYQKYLEKETEFNNGINTFHQTEFKLNNDLEELVQYSKNKLDFSIKNSNSINENSVITSISLSIISLLLMIFIIFSLTNSIKKPLRKILKSLNSLTKGDMTSRLNVENDGNEFNEIGYNIDKLSSNLQSLILEISQASKTVLETANKNEDMLDISKENLNKQNNETSSVATAMVEMEHSIEEVSNNAITAYNKVQEAETSTLSGSKLMNENKETIERLQLLLNESINAVQDVQDSSSDIVSILDVIKGIADQTNLLALNAAIEAARAGEQGRGFAVVADEVRMLSQKTTASVSEIDNTISDLQTKSKNASEKITVCVDEMSQSVSQAIESNNMMDNIKDIILQVSELSTYISEASKEQTFTAKEIAKNIEDINRLSSISYDAILSNSEESSKLKTIALKQDEIVKQFKIG